MLIRTMVFVVLGLLASQFGGDRAPAPVPTQFSVSVTVSEIKDGQSVVVARPALVVEEGSEATIRMGDEFVDEETKETIPCGLDIRIKVRELADSRLHLSIRANYGVLEAQDRSDILIREQGVRCVRTGPASEVTTIALTENRSLTISAARATAKP